MKIWVCELLAWYHKLSQNHKSKIINLPVYLLCIVFKYQSPSRHLFNIASAKREHKSQRQSRILGDISQSLLFSSTWQCAGKLPWACRAPRASADLVASTGGLGLSGVREVLGEGDAAAAPGDVSLSHMGPIEHFGHLSLLPCRVPPAMHFCCCRDRGLPVCSLLSCNPAASPPRVGSTL